MNRSAALSRPAHPDPLPLALLRFVLVAGCASALMMARYPLPF